MKLDIYKKKQQTNTYTIITQAYHSRCSSWKLSSKARIARGTFQPGSCKVKNENDVIRNRISDLAKRRISILSYESTFSRHMTNMGNVAEYFMLFRWKRKILVWLCIFYKNFGVKNKGAILFTNHFYLGRKENSLKIDWDPVELSEKTAMISTKLRPPQNYYLFWTDLSSCWKVVI